MRSLLLGVLLNPLTACTGHPADTTPPADDTAPDTGNPLVDPDWGVVEDCTTQANGGFDDFYTDGSAVLVYGDDEREAAYAADLADYYSRYVTLDLRAYADLTDDDRAKDLFIIGSPATNPLLGKLNGAVPVWFEEGDFVFGGHRYEEHGNGVAFVHPSPFAAGKWITVYAGNSFEGMYSTFTTPTGGHDYDATRGRGVVMQEGDFCRDGEIWSYYDKNRFVSEDSWPTWQGWLDQLDETTTDHHVFRYLPGSYAAAHIDRGAAAQEEKYAAVVDALGVDPLDEPITTYLYPDNETKGEITGDSGNGHANDLDYEDHMVFSADVDAFTIHEDIHVIAWYRIGAAQYSLMGEGLAVDMEGEWWGTPLSNWASTYKSDGTLPSLADLEDDWSGIDDGVSYPVAGQFVQWLAATWGMETVKALYVEPDLDAGFESELGMTHDEVETAWLDDIP